MAHHPANKFTGKTRALFSRIIRKPIRRIAVIVLVGVLLVVLAWWRGRIIRIALVGLFWLVPTALFVIGVLSNIDTVAKSMPNWMRSILTNPVLTLVLLLSGWVYLIELGKEAYWPPAGITFPSIPPPQFNYTTVQRPDPALMKPSIMLTMIGAFRQSAIGHGPTTFLISSYPGNEWVKEELEALMTLSCQGNQLPQQYQCYVSPAPLVSKRDRQGLTIHISEPKFITQNATSQQIGQSLSYWFPGSMAQWFIVTKDPYIPDVVMERVGDNFSKFNVVWIEVGPGSPWADDDVRLKKGLTRAEIDRLRNWGVPLRDHLVSIADRLDKLPRNATGRAIMMGGIDSAYKGLMSELFQVCNEAKWEGLNSTSIEKMVVDSQDYQHQRIDDIRDGLRSLSAGLAQKTLQ
jgi:Ca2+/Na+ antiporter